MAARKRTKRIQRDLVPAFKQELWAWNERTGTNALAAFESLVRAGCSDEYLMGMVVALRAAWEFEAKAQAAPRMNSRRLRSLVDRTCSVAREWEQEFQSPFGKIILEGAASRDVFCKKHHYLNLPQMLRSLVAEAEAIHRGSSRERRPLYNDTLAALMEYVNLKTSHYRDPQVSTLVWFATGRECDANTFGVWRNEHPEALERARHRHTTP